MLRLVKADLRRIFTRVPRNAIILAIILGSVIMGVMRKNSLYSSVDNLITNLGILTTAAGLFEIVFIYGDDLKAKNIQMAIGTGMQRSKIVYAKWIEFAVASFVDLFVFSILGILVSVILYGTSGGCDLKTFTISFLMTWVSMIAYLASMMFLIFLLQGISLTLLLYIISSMGVLVEVIPQIAQLLHIGQYHLQTYTLTNMLDSVAARLLMGHVSGFNLAGVLAYMVVGFVLATVLFKKKELEF